MSAPNPVDIVGAGAGADGTILRSANSNFSLDIQLPGSTVSNLRVRVENQTGIFESGIFLSGAGVVANGVTVLGEPGVDNAVGVIVRTGAILRNSLVQVPLGNANQAIGAEEGAFIENVSAAGERMIDARTSGAPVDIRRLRSSTPSHEGIVALGGGSVNVSDALIRLSGGSTGGGLMAEATPAGSPTIVARHVTVVGTGDAVNAGRGVYAGGFNAGRNPTVDVRDSIFHALSTDLEVEAFSGSIARIPIGYSDYNPAKVVDTSAGDAAVVAGAGNLLANPGFVDGAAADFRLRADSQMIDRGSPGGGSTTDLDGLPRPNDGNGDGVAVRDLGAFSTSAGHRVRRQCRTPRPPSSGSCPCTSGSTGAAGWPWCCAGPPTRRPPRAARSACAARAADSAERAFRCDPRRVPSCGSSCRAEAPAGCAERRGSASCWW